MLQALLAIFLLLGVAKRNTAITDSECGAPQRSIVSDTSLHLVFSNETKGTVTVYWLDFKGERVWYNTLAARESYTQQTFVTHPWVIVDADGRCIEQLVPNAAGTFDVPIR
ncbi:MAG TPA: hypothetical protein VGM39_15680 [Kofleriaceae bacterium]